MSLRVCKMKEVSREVDMGVRTHCKSSSKAAQRVRILTVCLLRIPVVLRTLGPLVGQRLDDGASKPSGLLRFRSGPVGL